MRQHDMGHLEVGDLYGEPKMQESGDGDGDAPLLQRSDRGRLDISGLFGSALIKPLRNGNTREIFTSTDIGENIHEGFVIKQKVYDILDGRNADREPRLTRMGSAPVTRAPNSGTGAYTYVHTYMRTQAA
jgi:hypothetical protein